VRLSRATGMSPLKILEMDAAEVAALMSLVSLSDAARTNRVMSTVNEIASDSKGMCSAHWLIPLLLEGLNG
jgi:hypothetical protein